MPTSWDKVSLIDAKIRIEQWWVCEKLPCHNAEAEPEHIQQAIRPLEFFGKLSSGPFAY
jgi:hypothetical protein